MVKAHALAMLEIIQDAERRAKENAKRQFIGRNGRRLTGRLLNAIYSGFTPFRPGQSLPRGFIGTRGIPYGRIHEFGGTITPKTARHLWIKQWGGRADKYRRMTPREFIQAKEQDPDRFAILTSKRGGMIAAELEKRRNRPSNITALFVLKDKVTIPARPYLIPAIEDALEAYPKVARRLLTKELLSIK